MGVLTLKESATVPQQYAPTVNATASRPICSTSTTKGNMEEVFGQLSGSPYTVLGDLDKQLDAWDGLEAGDMSGEETIRSQTKEGVAANQGIHRTQGVE